MYFYIWITKREICITFAIALNPNFIMTFIQRFIPALMIKLADWSYK